MATNLTLYIKQGDTAGNLRAQILDGTDPVNLTTAGVIRLKVQDPTGTLVINNTVTIENQTTNPGWINYTWTAGQTDTLGVHRAELEVTWGNGKVQTFPPDQYATIVVVPDLG